MVILLGPICTPATLLVKNIGFKKEMYPETVEINGVSIYVHNIVLGRNIATIFI